MANQSGFSNNPHIKKPKPNSGLAGQSAGGGALGGATHKVDPAHNKPRKRPSAPNPSIKTQK